MQTQYAVGMSPSAKPTGNVFEFCPDLLNYYAGIRGDLWKADCGRAHLKVNWQTPRNHRFLHRHDERLNWITPQPTQD